MTEAPLTPQVVQQEAERQRKIGQNAAIKEVCAAVKNVATRQTLLNKMIPNGRCKLALPPMKHLCDEDTALQCEKELESHMYAILDRDYYTFCLRLHSHRVFLQIREKNADPYAKEAEQAEMFLGLYYANPISASVPTGQRMQRLSDLLRDDAAAECAKAILGQWQ